MIGAGAAPATKRQKASKKGPGKKKSHQNQAFSCSAPKRMALTREWRALPLVLGKLINCSNNVKNRAGRPQTVAETVLQNLAGSPQLRRKRRRPVSYPAELWASSRSADPRTGSPHRKDAKWAVVRSRQCTPHVAHEAKLGYPGLVGDGPIELEHSLTLPCDSMSTQFPRNRFRATRSQLMAWSIEFDHLHRAQR